MKKTLLISVFLLIFVFALTGCSNKEPINAETFDSIMTDEGYHVIDISDQFEEDFVETVLVALKDEKYQIEFFDLKAEKDTKASYNKNVKNFEARKGDSSLESSVSMGNFSSYKLTTEEEYCVVSRVGDTFVYADVPKEYKNEINDVLKKLGY